MILSNTMSFKTLGEIERMIAPVSTYTEQLYGKPVAIYNTMFSNQTATYRGYGDASARALDRAFQNS